MKFSYYTQTVLVIFFAFIYCNLGFSTNALALPDLMIPSGVPSLTPSTVEPGGSFTLSDWTVKNQGTTSSSNFKNGFYLSTNNIISTSDIYLSGNSNLGLSPGEEFTWNGPNLTVPANTAPGTYYVGILVDREYLISESDETNNYVTCQINVVTYPDLTIISGDPTITPSTVAPGGSIKLSDWTVMNQGTWACGSFQNGFYLSTNAVISTADTYLGHNNNPGLNAGEETFWEGSTLTLPADIEPSTYYIGILVDHGYSVSESVESNNYVSQKITVTHLGFIPALNLLLSKNNN